MTTELERFDPAPAVLPAKIEYARTLAASNLLPPEYRGKPENVLWATEYADLLGLHPMAIVTGIHVISGRPSASAALISALVRRAGHKLRVERITEGARCTIVRKDDPDFPHVAEFTMADAQRAGLMSNDNWKKRPATMCEWRAVTQCARLACAEVLHGVAYTPDELHEATGDNGVHEVTSVRRVTAAEILHRPTVAIERVEPETVTEAEPAPPATDTPEGITKAQLRMLQASMGEAGITEREDRLDYIAGQVGHPVASTNDLTKDEASRVIDSLQQGAS